jgi:hypothetical protein
LANFFRNVVRFWERLSRAFVFDEFDAEKKPKAAEFAHIRMRLQRRKSFAQSFAGGNHALEKIVCFKIINDSVARGGGDRMSLIREAVQESAGAALERFNDTRGNENGAERRVPAGNSLPDQNNVRLDAPVLDGKSFSGAAHAGHDFVSDKENAVFAADFGDARSVANWRHGGAESGANDWLENKGCGLIGLVFVKMDIEIISAHEFALRKSFVERAVVAEAWRDVAPFGEERFVRRAAGDVAAHGHRAKGAPVITLAPRKNAVASLLAGFEMILTREFYRGLRGFRAAGSEKDAAAVTEIRWSDSEEARGKFFRCGRMKLRGVRKSDLRGLLGHGAADFLNAVADADDRSLPGSIQEAPAIGRNNPAAFTAKGNRKRLLKMAGKKSAARRHEMSGKGL